MPEFYADSHPGCVEQSNEDCVGWDVEHGVWLVADGMGGHARGEVASRLVKETVLEEVGRDLPLLQAVLDAHKAVVAAALASEDQAQMGSTVVAARIDRGHCDVIWVGDSRAYVFSRGTLKRVSRDHSLMELLIERNVVSEAEARVHPQRHLVTQSLGMGEPEPDEEHVSLHRGDRVLLCSDGLTDELSDEEIAAVLARAKSSREAGEALMRAALDKGARDNVSVVVIEADRGARVRERLHAQWKPIAFGALGAIVFLLLLELFELRR